MKNSELSRQQKKKSKRKPMTARKGGKSAKAKNVTASGIVRMMFGGGFHSPMFTPQRKKFKGIDKENKRLKRGRFAK